LRLGALDDIAPPFLKVCSIRASDADGLIFIEQLAALAPPPRAHQLTYHGVLAPAAALRSRIVPAPATSRRRCAVVGSPRMTRRYPWAELLRRVFALDVLRCQKCAGRRRLIAQITQSSVVTAMLSSLGLSSVAPRVHPAVLGQRGEKLGDGTGSGGHGPRS
jgi:hypothetical protein